jgi:TetR/AcrR family transcriptional regulator, transcriptional repressor for nem operon
MSSRPTSTKPIRGHSRRAILDAAVKLVRRHGWAATSVDQLCAEAGVTKGAFFHHFGSKEALGIAAAQHWDEVTAVKFAGAPYHALPDPLDRVIGYIDFRAELTEGELEAITCFAGTVVQEVFASSDALRAAVGGAIDLHAGRLIADIQAAIELYPPVHPLSAESLATYTQTVVQGGFILAKAAGDRAPLLDAIAHLKTYVLMLFGKDITS